MFIYCTGFLWGDGFYLVTNIDASLELILDVQGIHYPTYLKFTFKDHHI